MNIIIIVIIIMIMIMIIIKIIIIIIIRILISSDRGALLVADNSKEKQVDLCENFRYILYLLQSLMKIL